MIDDEVAPPGAGAEPSPATESDEPPRTLEVGRVLSRTFSVWASNLVPFAALGCAFFSPMILWSLALAVRDPSTITADELRTYELADRATARLLGDLLTAVLTFSVVQQLRGEPAPLGACLKVGLSRVFYVIGVSIVVGLAILAGLIMLIIPAIIFTCMYAVAVPVVVVERTSITGAMTRSQELTKGSRPAIFGVLLLLGLISLGVVMATAAAVEASNPQTYWGEPVMQLVATVVATLAATGPAVMYHELRTAREGSAVLSEELAAVFD